MKPGILYAFLVILVFSCLPDPGNQAKKEELRTVLTNYYDALVKKDFTKMNLYTTSSFVMYDEGRIYNNQSALESVQEMGNFSVTFRFDSIKAHIDKTNASIYYIKEAVFTIEDSTYAPVTFLESATFEKQNKEWKIRFLHSSRRM